VEQANIKTARNGAPRQWGGIFLKTLRKAELSFYFYRPLWEYTARAGKPRKFK